MSEQFDRLNPDDVVLFVDDENVFVEHSTLLVREFDSQIGTVLENLEDYPGEAESYEKLINEGLACKVLRSDGSGGWKEGRIRIRIEFCEDEPSPPASSLDIYRQNAPIE
jgi:hypothetical protein